MIKRKYFVSGKIINGDTCIRFSGTVLNTAWFNQSENVYKDIVRALALEHEVKQCDVWVQQFYRI